MDMSDIEAPFERYRDRVRPAWIDHNGHMNMGYYVVVFDLASDMFLHWLGLDPEHRRSQRVTTFAAEAHVTYHREVGVDAPLAFSTRLLGFDAKRIHYFHEMRHAEEGFLAATNELLSLHVSQETRRVAPMAPALLERLERIRAAHAALPLPPQVGRVIAVGRPR